MIKLPEKTRARLLKQRAEMRGLVEQEFAILRDHVSQWLVAAGDPDLVACPVVDLVLRRLHRECALDLPADWALRISEALSGQERAEYLGTPPV